jgi:hypothetical protein
MASACGIAPGHSLFQLIIAYAFNDEDDADEGDESEDSDEETTIETYLEKLNEALQKWKARIPQECRAEIGTAVLNLCNYIEQHMPHCPICGKSAAEMELEHDEAVVAHDRCGYKP